MYDAFMMTLLTLTKIAAGFGPAIVLPLAALAVFAILDRQG